MTNDVTVSFFNNIGSESTPRSLRQVLDEIMSSKLQPAISTIRQAVKDNDPKQLPGLSILLLINR